MRIGQQIEGSGGSDMPAVAQALLLCSILGILVLGVVLEVHKTLTPMAKWSCAPCI
jgi:hypothetical protein